MKQYPDDCYDGGSFDNLAAARAIAPIVMQLVNPTSVVDIGCGSGAWLQAFHECGVREVRGVDSSDALVNLRIPREFFHILDLSTRFKLERTFDLALCLEVAEHIGAEAATGLVDSLVSLAPVVLFSAAIPNQGGIRHVNERWPDYWRQLFSAHGYRRLDAIRKEIWLERSIPFYYRQNLFLFAGSEIIKKSEPLTKALLLADDMMLIHSPILERQFNLRPTVRRLPSTLKAFLRHVVGRD